MGDLASDIWQARQSGGLLSRDLVADVDGRAGAYAVQNAAVAASGLTRAGWKIAATSGMAQELLGLDGPAIGPVFAEHLYKPGDTLPAEAAHGAAIECEVAFVLGDDIGNTPDIGMDGLLEKTERALIAVELVGCRFEGGFKDAGASVCISDFAFNGALVCGADIDGWREMDLASVAASITINGDAGNSGTGAAVLGNPLTALQWAANEAQWIGTPLRKGDIVSTGTMTGVTPVKPGDEVLCDFGALGQIQLSFVDA